MNLYCNHFNTTLVIFCDWVDHCRHSFYIWCHCLMRDSKPRQISSSLLEPHLHPCDFQLCDAIFSCAMRFSAVRCGFQLCDAIFSCAMRFSAVRCGFQLCDAIFSCAMRFQVDVWGAMVLWILLSNKGFRSRTYIP
jgi:hypothetical protein